jgi:hypothetical protein
MQTIRIARKDVVELYQHLTDAERHATNNPKLTYAMARTMAKLKGEMDAIQTACKLPEGFEKDRIALCERMAKRDSAGKAQKTPNGKAYDIADAAAFAAALDELKAKFDMDGHQKRCEAMLEELVDVEFYPLPVTEDNVPPAWTPATLTRLLPIVAAEPATAPAATTAPASEAKPAGAPALTLVPKH